MAGRIVVAVDGSEHSERALAWARDEARLRGAALELVHAVAQPEIVVMPAVLPMPTHEELEKAGHQLVDRMLEDLDTEGLDVDRRVDSGGAARLIVEAAQHADLVVVGARGMGGFRGLLLGSVSQQVVAHCPCPVVVVTPESR